ncbi:amidohydrolase family protein [Sphingomonas sp. PAMC 26605]|uniref:amidohydrolase family protein n=1 Tax=Sphingomonas sp. PAMC 26605 TaxID=1112214 RepID=UPI00026CDE3F|nr:amidohydrolase family protein [Sphingomonas sp. PAMC 26605]
MTASIRNRTLIRGGIVLSMDPVIGDFARGDVLVEGDKIIAVGGKLEVEDAEFIEADGMIVMPGLIDAHRHAWQGTLRRVMPNVETLDAYIDATHYSLARFYRPEDMYLGNRLTALGCLDAGTTTIIDASHNARSAEHSDASIDAIEDAGLRALHMPGRPLAGGWAEHWPDDLERLQSDRFASSDQLVTLGMFSSPDPANWAVARRLGLPILTEFLGMMAPMLPGLADAGMLGPDNIFNHCTALPPQAWAMLRDAGVRVTVDARSDAQYALGDGIFAYQAAIDHGLRPALGTDLETAYGGDMFTEMRTAFFLQRAIAQSRRHAGDQAAPTPATVGDILKAATINGAHAAGLENRTGSLSPGKQADIILIRTTDINVFPTNNVVGTIVQAADRSNVDTVMVAGTIRKANGRLLGVDLKKLEREVCHSLEYLFEAAGYEPDIFAANFPALPGEKPEAWAG